MNFTADIIIGLEIHIGLNTKTKLFCSCKNDDCNDLGISEPNLNVCPVCLGHPGAKPVVNIEAIKSALKLCYCAKCEIAKEVVFSRKSYFYPDLGKNYQTTQYEIPIGLGGEIELPSGKKISLTRIHIEEDPASLVHVGGLADAKFSFIDYNRSGTPLVELVTNPDLNSPEEAREFMKTLIGILSYLGIFDLKNGLIKADANISIKESNYTRAEIKNINGFKEIERALFSEIDRQKKAVSNGEKLCIETRGWNSETGTTYLMRKKESEADYGYIIDTDLVPIELTEEIKNEIKKNLPKIPIDFAKEISKQYNLNFEDVYIIANQKAFSEVYLKAIMINPDLATNWFRHIIPKPFIAEFGDLELTPKENINEEGILELFKLFNDKKISDKVAKDILEKLVLTKFSPKDFIKENNLEMVSNTGELESFCKDAINENPQAIQDFNKGEMKSLNFLVGQVMKKSKGKANPAEVRKIIEEILK